MNYKRFPLGALWTNGYLFWDDESQNAFFIDPGGKTDEVKKFLEEHNLKLTMILLTHGHIDTYTLVRVMRKCFVIRQHSFRHCSEFTAKA